MGKATSVLVLLLAVAIASTSAAVVLSVFETVANGTLHYNEKSSSNAFYVTQVSGGSPDYNDIEITCNLCTVFTSDNMDGIPPVYLHFDAGANVVSKYFGITPTTANGDIVIHFTSHPGPNAVAGDWSTPPADPFAYRASKLSVDWTSLDGSVVGQDTPAQVTHSANGPAKYVIFTPTAPGVVFTPSYLNFTSGSQTIDISYRASSVGTGNQITFSTSLSGPEAAQYNSVNDQAISISSLEVGSDFFNNNIMYGTTFPFNVYTGDIGTSYFSPVQGITVKPVCTDSVVKFAETSGILFNPVSEPFQPEYNFQATAIATGAFNVSFQLSGADVSLFTTPNANVNYGWVMPLDFAINVPSSIRVGESSSYTIVSISGFPLSTLTVTLTSQDNLITFLDPIVFTPTVKVVSIRWRANAVTSTNFWVAASYAGTDSAYVNPFNKTDVSAAILTKPSVYFPANISPALTEGGSSIGWPVHVNVAPSSDLTVNIASTLPAEFTVTPSTFTFGPSNPGVLSFVFTVKSIGQRTSIENAGLTYTLTGALASQYALSTSSAAVSSTFVGSVQTPGFGSNNPQVVAGEKYGPFTLYVDVAPLAPMNVLLSCPSAEGITNPCTFTPSSTLTFSPTVLSVEYYVSFNIPPIGDTIHYTIPVSYALDTTVGTDYNWYWLANSETFFDVYMRNLKPPGLSVVPTIANNQAFQLHQLSRPYYFVLPYPPRSALAISLISDGDVVFTPSTLNFAAGVSMATFQITPTKPTTGTNLKYSITSGDALYYEAAFQNFAKITSSGPTVTVPGPFAPLVASVQSPLYSVVVSGPVTDLKINMSCPGVVFTPATLVFGAGDTVKTFSMLANAPIQTNAMVSFFLSGADASLVSAIPDVDFKNAGGAEVPPLSQYSITMPTIPALLVNQPWTGVVSLSAFPPTDVSITPFANGVEFSPSIFTFSSSTRFVTFTATGRVVSAWIDQNGATITGYTGITTTFTLGGTDAALFAPISNQHIVVNAAPVPTISTTVSYIQVGVWSDPEAFYYVVDKNVNETLTYTLTSTAGVSFNPSTPVVVPAFPRDVYSTNGRYFQVMSSNVGSFQITLTITGGSSSEFTATTTTLVVTANPFSFSFPSISGSVKIGERFPPNAMYAVSTLDFDGNVVDTPYTFTITPQAVGLAFSPASLTLSPGKPSAYFYFNATQYNHGQPTFITYKITTSAPASVYTFSYTPQTVTTTPRSLGTSITDNFPAAVYAGWTGDYEVIIEDHVLSNAGLTITPHMAHVTFTPDHIDVNPSDHSVRFSMTADKVMPPGDITYEIAVTGADLPLYGGQTTAYTGVSSITARTLYTEIGTSNSVSQGLVYGESTWVHFTVDENANVPLTDAITITPDAQGVASASFTFEPSILTLAPGAQSGNFKVTLLKTAAFPSGSEVAIGFKFGGAGMSNTIIDNSMIYISPKMINGNVGSTYNSFFGIPSADWTITLDHAAPNGLTITPNAQDNVVFTPPAWTFAAGETQASIKYTAQSTKHAQGSTTIDVYLVMSGTDADIVSLDTLAPQFVVASNDLEYVKVNIVGSITSDLDSPFTFGINLDDYPNKIAERNYDLIVTPYAQGVTFTPPYVDFSTGQQEFVFSSIVSSQLIGDTFGGGSLSRQIYYKLSGTDAYKFVLSQSSTTLTLTKHTIYVGYLGGAISVGQEYGPFDVWLDGETIPSMTSPIIVDIITSANLVANPTFVTFDGSAEISDDRFFSITGTAVGSGTVHFQIRDAGADVFIMNVNGASVDVTNTVSFNIEASTVSWPSAPSFPFYSAIGAVQTWSLTLSNPAVGGLTVTPSGVGLTCTPAVFLAGQTEATFTVVVNSLYNHPLHFAFSGPDLQYYVLDSSLLPTGSGMPILSGGSARTFDVEFYDYTVWINEASSENYVTLSDPAINGVTLTPVSDVAIFTPATFTFGPGESSQWFTFTIDETKTVVDRTIWVTFTVGGQDQADYILPDPVYVTLVGGDFNWDPDTTYREGEVSWGKVSISPLPTDGSTITITPVCDGLEFTPSTFQFDANTATIRYSVLPTKVGQFLLSTTIDESEFSYYWTPTNTWTVTINAPTIYTSLSTDNFIAGVTYADYTLHVNTPVAVTVTPHAIGGDVVFEPSSFAFTADSSFALFSITPAPAGFGGAALVEQSIIVYWTITDGDSSINVPGPVTLVVSSRSIDLPIGDLDLTKGQQMDRYASVTIAPPTSVKVNVYGNGLTFTPNVLEFTPNNQVVHFTVEAASYGYDYYYWYEIDTTSTDAALYTLGYDDSDYTTFGVAVRQVSLKLPTIAHSYATALLPGVPSATYSVSVPPGDYQPFTVTPSAAGFVFTPPVLTFGAGVLVQDFTVTAQQPTGDHGTDLTYTVDSDEIKMPHITTIYAKLLTFNVENLQASLPAVDSNSLSGLRRVVTIDNPIFDATNTVTLTLSAPGVTFSSSPLVFSNAVSAIPVTITVTPGAYTSTIITYTVGGNLKGWFATPAPATWSISAGLIPINGPSYDTVPAGARNFGRYTISVPSAVTSTLTVQATAIGVEFEPAVFAVGDKDAVFRILSATHAISSSEVAYTITGANSALYTINSGTITVTTKTFYAPSYGEVLVMQTETDLSISCSMPPTTAVTVTPWGAGLTFSPPSLPFGPDDTVLYFSVTPTVSPTSFGSDYIDVPVQYFITGDSATEFAAIDAGTIRVAPYQLDTSISDAIVGIQSEPCWISLQGLPAGSEVTVKPTMFGAVFSPASVTFTPDMFEAEFTFVANYAPASGSITVTYELSGTNSELVALSTDSITVYKRSITIPTHLGTNYVGVTSVAVPISLDFLPQGAGSLTITGVADSVTFSGPVVFDSSSELYQTFTFTVDEDIGSSTITWYLSGTEAEFYEIPDTSDVDMRLRAIDVFPSGSIDSVKPGMSVWVDISTEYPVPNGITITPIGTATFTPASITFDATTTSVSLQIVPSTVDSIDIEFAVTGSDAYMFDDVDSFTINVDYLNFYGMESIWDDESVAPLLGQLSSPFKIFVDSPPPNGVTLIPSSPYLEFVPPVLEFTPSTQFVLGQFKVTSRHARYTSYHHINWAIGGQDAAIFNTVGRTTIQIEKLSDPYYYLDFENLPSSTIVGIPSQPITVRAIPTPPNGITITPNMPHVQGFTFSPASFDLTPASPVATFTYTATVPSTTDYPIEFSIKGQDVSLYGQHATVTAPQVQMRQFLDVPSGGMGIYYAGHVATNTWRISLDYPTTNGVSLTLSNPSGALTFTPSILNFAPGTNTAGFAVSCDTVTKSEFIYYTVGGNDAALYDTPYESVISFVQIPISVTVAGKNFGASNPPTLTVDYDRPYEVRFVLASPPPNGLTLGVVAPAGFAVSSSTVNFAAGTYQASTMISATDYGASSSTYGAVTFTLAGKDAGLYSLPPNFVLDTAQPTYSVSGLMTGTVSSPAATNPHGYFDLGVSYDLTFSLTRMASSDMTFTVVSDKFTVAPVVIPAGQLQATTTVQFTSTGAGSWEYYASGTDAYLYSQSGKSQYRVFVYPRQIVLQTSSHMTTTVGGWTPPFDYMIKSIGNGFSASTPSTFNVTFVINPPGAVVIDTPVIVVSYPSSTFTFRASPKILGTSEVTVKLVGTDAALYTAMSTGQSGAADQFRLQVTGTKRQFGIMPATTSTPTTTQSIADKVQNGLTGSTGLQLTVGVPSRPITITAGAVSTKVGIVLEGRGLVFSPSVVAFTGAFDSLSFTITATEVITGSVYVHFTLIGQDASLFDTPAPLTVNVQPLFVVPEFPILTIGVPVTLSMSVASNISSPIVVTPLVANVVFLPESFLFSPQQTTVQFQVVGIATNDVLNLNKNPVETGEADNTNIGAQSFGMYWRFMYTPVDSNTAWVAPVSAIHINVLPAGFVVSFPHLQIGQTSTLTISTTAPPRSDVVLTLIGNNLNFNPPNLLFTKSNTVATVAVTPVHADYKDFDNLPFTVDYIISGTNKADFIPPAQSFLAVSRGTAPQADSLQLSAASPAAYAASLFVLAAAVFALIM